MTMAGIGDLLGVPKYKSPVGGNGPVTVDPGGILHLIIVHASMAGATLSIFGGDAIPIVNGANPTVIQMFHTLYQSNAVNAGAIVGVNTDMLVVHWIRPGHAAP